MLRVELRDSAEALNVKLEGRLTRDDAEHIRMLIARCADRVKLAVDLTEVVFVDAIGEGVLSFLGRLGAEFVAGTSYTLDVCERLHLPVANRNTARASRANDTHSSADSEL
jgi:hypothetical protein